MRVLGEFQWRLQAISSYHWSGDGWGCLFDANLIAGLP